MAKNIILVVCLVFNVVHSIRVDYKDNFMDNLMKGVPHSLDLKEDALLNTCDISRKYGYDFETYNVMTEDGYILGLYRVYHRKVKRNGEVVLLMHGWMGSSDDWITPGPGRSPAFYLADCGYDVWLGNVRGNKHSLKHVNMSHNDMKFWDFHLDHISLIDVRSMVDYILKITKKKKIYYLGVSQGTFVINILLSSMPEYNEKFKLVVELAPVAWFDYLKSPLFLAINALSPHIYKFSKESGIGDFYLRIGLLLAATVKMFCHKTSPFLRLCYIALTLLDGSDLKHVEPQDFSTYFTHTFAGCSPQQVEHYTQVYNTGEFKRYDYGSRRNLKVYGTKTPPFYKIGNFTAPVMMVYGLNDQIAHPNDVKRLYRTLPNVVDLYLVPRKKFNHIDFSIGNDLKELVMKRVLTTMKSYL